MDNFFLTCISITNIYNQYQIDLLVKCPRVSDLQSQWPRASRKLSNLENVLFSTAQRKFFYYKSHLTTFKPHLKEKEEEIKRFCKTIIYFLPLRNSTHKFTF